jgi:pyruvate/2-oxoglutarate dehydrogenase complex dihydrolipoamide dehydrogenase (E3) component
MHKKQYDLIAIGAGSAGLSTSLFLNEAGLKVLLIDRTDHNIGGDCLNDGCVPSKALIHVARLVHSAREAGNFGFRLEGLLDVKKVTAYIHARQEVIRKHENAAYFRKQGLDVALGNARFVSVDTVEVNGRHYIGKKIVIATGSRPRKLKIPGIEKVIYYDNESIFHLNNLPKKLLVIGGGPIGMEIGQALSRLGSKVTVVHREGKILKHDDEAVTNVLYKQLQNEGIDFIFNAEVDSFPTANETIIKYKDGSSSSILFDAIFVGIGRQVNTEGLGLEKAGIGLAGDKIIVNEYLQTTNKNVYVCGDVAGSLQFSHAAEQQGRLLLNNFFSPIKKKLNNDNMSWVTFTDPEIATFGLQEKTLKERGVRYRRLETDFAHDDRAITDNYQYGRLILFISQGGKLHTEKILGGSMVAPGAGELIQELILANIAKIPLKTIFDKVYPYPVAARVNQKAIIEYKQEGLTTGIKKLLHLAFKIIS